MKKILVPFDPTPTGEKALEFAFDEYAQDGRDLLIEAVYFNNHDEEPARSLYKKKVDEIAEKHDLDEGNINFNIVVRSEDTESPRKVGKLIIDYIQNNDFDNVIMGQHGKGLKESILEGSASKKVANNSPIPVTIVP